MNIKTVRIAVACFIGSFLGAQIAIDIRPDLWWAGVILGGVIAWVTYCFRDVPQAFRQAWKRLREVKIPKIPWDIIRRVWNMCIEGVTALVLIVCALCAGFLALVGFLTAMCTAMASFLNAGYLYYTFFRTESLFPLWYLFAGTLLTMVVGLVYSIWDRESRTTSDFCLALMGGFAVSPIGAFVTIPLIAIVIVIVVCIVTYALGILLFWTFKFVHSDEALLCLTDGAIGSFIGYYYGHAIIGGIAGAVWGVINFEIVSKRLLKLVPRTT